MIDIRGLVSRLDAGARTVISAAADRAYKSRHPLIEVEHVLLSILTSGESGLLDRVEMAGASVSKVTQQLDYTLLQIPKGDAVPPGFSDLLVDVLRDAWLTVSLNDESSKINTEALVVAMFGNRATLARLNDSATLLRRFSLDRFQGVAALTANSITGGREEPESAIRRFTTDVTALALKGELDRVIGRDREIDQMIEVLMRRRQNNPVLTGEAGVGKTAIVEGFAQRIVEQRVPQALSAVRLLSVDIGALRAGSGVRGEIESRLKALTSEISALSTPIILFIDEIHTMVSPQTGASADGDIANLIKPALARGTLRTIGATTWSEFKRSIEKDAALARRFQVVKVVEPSTEETVRILKGVCPKLEAHHRLHITQGAIEAAVHLSTRYIQGRQQPDKAISILDTACARKVAGTGNSCPDGAMPAQSEAGSHAEAIGLEGRTAIHDLDCEPSGASPSKVVPQLVTVSGDDVASVIADMTGIPSTRMLQNQTAQVLELKESLALRVIGQERATHMICDRLMAYAAGLGDPARPIGVFMLVGPSGVGKTETAHAISDMFFGGAAAMTVVNMSEYQEAHTVSKLKGAPPGYIGYGQGGTLTEQVRRRPYGLLLLDEIEKAHPDVLDLFLQVFDKGFMEDSEGILVDFKNTLIILTSNVGAQWLSGHGHTSTAHDQEGDFVTRLQEQLLHRFKPALLSRVNVVPYFPLGDEQIMEIARGKLSKVSERYAQAYKSEVMFSKALVRAIATNCLNAVVGARWIDQFVMEHIVPQLSREVLSATLGEVKGPLRMGWRNDGVIFEKSKTSTRSVADAA